jgi:hypothetical protein
VVLQNFCKRIGGNRRMTLVLKKSMKRATCKWDKSLGCVTSRKARQQGYKRIVNNKATKRKKKKKEKRKII